MRSTFVNGYRLWLDLQAVQGLHAPERGIARYSLELTRALKSRGAPIVGIGLNPVLVPPRALPPDISNASELKWTTAQSFAATADDGPLIYHALSPFEFFSPPEVLFPRFVRNGHALAVTIYDLIPYKFPDAYQDSTQVRAMYRARRETVRRADLFLVLSEHSKRDLTELFGVEASRCHVIGGGVSPFFGPPEHPEAPQRRLAQEIPQLQRPFVLSVGGWEWRKNNETLIAAFAGLPPAIRQEHQLVIVCNLPAERARAWRDLAATCGLTSDDLILTGRVPDRTLRALYQSAALFVFPSRYEGFGLPVIEAGRCGCPVLASNASSISEVLECAAATFPSDDMNALSGLMTRALESETFQSELREAAIVAAGQHTWERVAERAQTAYDSLPAAGPRRTPAVPRLALIGLNPDDRSGSGSVHARLLDAIGPRLEIDLFHDERGRRELAFGRRTFPVEQLGRMFRPEHYDALVYLVGPDTHRKIVDVAMDYPGIAWLQDGAGSPKTSQAIPWHEMPWATLDGAGGRDPNGPRNECEPEGSTSIPDIVSASRHVIIDSEYVWRSLKLEVGPFRPCPEFSLLPMPIPSAQELGLTRIPGKPAGDTTVVAWDSFDTSTVWELLLGAISGCNLIIPVRLRLFGDPSPEQRSAIVSRAAQLGIGDRVTTTSCRDAHDIGRELTAATCGVHLDSSEQGQAAGTVLSALAVGRPVITNIPGWSDVPQPVVIRVPTKVTAEELTKSIIDVILDAPEWDHRHNLALRYARRWTIDNVATKFVQLVTARCV